MKIEINNTETIRSKLDFATTCINNAIKWPPYRLRWLSMSLNQIEQAMPFLLEEIAGCDVEAAEQLAKDNVNLALKAKRLVG